MYFISSFLFGKVYANLVSKNVPSVMAGFLTIVGMNAVIYLGTQIKVYQYFQNLVVDLVKHVEFLPGCVPRVVQENTNTHGKSRRLELHSPFYLTDDGSFKHYNQI